MKIRVHLLKTGSSEVINIILVSLNGIKKRYISLLKLIKIMDQFLYIILKKKVRIHTISYVNNLIKRGVRKIIRSS